MSVKGFFVPAGLTVLISLFTGPMVSADRFIEPIDESSEGTSDEESQPYPCAELAQSRAATLFVVYKDMWDQRGNPNNRNIMKFINKEFARESPPAYMERIEDVKHLSETLTQYKGARFCIKRLVIEAHGEPGSNDIFSDITDLVYLQGLDTGFSPGAQIEIHSCSVGAGLIGTAFAERLGQTLLARGGGIIVAPKWIYFFDLGSPMGYRRYHVLPGGKGFFDERISLEDERTRIANELKDLGRLLQEQSLVISKLGIRLEVMSLESVGKGRLYRVYPHSEGAVDWIGAVLARGHAFLDGESLDWYRVAKAQEELHKARSLYEDYVQEPVQKFLRDQDRKHQREHSQRIRERGAQPGDIIYSPDGQEFHH